MAETIRVSLTPDEVLVLDGHTQNPDVVKVIERIKTERGLTTICGTDTLGTFLAKVVAHGMENGAIGYRWRSGECQVCHKPGHRVNYKSGRFKGMYKETIWYPCLDFDSGTVFTTNHTPFGICKTCLDEALPRLKVLFTDHADVCRFEWSPNIAPQKWRKSTRYHCTECGQDSWEYELRRLPALMGGYYPGGCPHCKAVNLPFGRRVIEHDFRTWQVFPAKED